MKLESGTIIGVDQRKMVGPNSTMLAIDVANEVSEAGLSCKELLAIYCPVGLVKRSVFREVTKGNVLMALLLH